MKQLLKYLPDIFRNSLLKYKSHKVFEEDGLLMRRFLESADLKGDLKEDASEVFWVVVTPWMQTATPWYAITLAILLKKKGINVQLIWDDLVFDDLSTGMTNITKEQNKVISDVLLKISNDFIILKMSDMERVSLNQKDEEELKRLAKVNAIHKFQSSIPSDLSRNYSEDWFQFQKQNLMQIKGLFKNHSYNRILLPGGVYGNSGLYYYLVVKKESVCTYDCGFNRALVCVNGITGYQSDVILCLQSEEIRNMNPDTKKRIMDITLHELGLRKSGSDFYMTQVLPSGNGEMASKYDIIMPLNITWDLPALGKHRFFDSDYDWVIETVQFILDNTNATIAVRQHPHERRHTSGRDFGRKITELFGFSDRFRFYSCDEPVNSYDLMEVSRIILPYVSTIGIEGALLGKSVIMESDSYYSHLSFVKRAESKSHYFQLIKEQMVVPSKLTNDQYEDALICYYITQLCTAETTIFTPHPANFREWVNLDFNELSKLKSVKTITTALSEDIPVALLNHRMFVNNQQ